MLSIFYSEFIAGWTKSFGILREPSLEKVVCHKDWIFFFLNQLQGWFSSHSFKNNTILSSTKDFPFKELTPWWICFLSPPFNYILRTLSMSRIYFILPHGKLDFVTHLMAPGNNLNGWLWRWKLTPFPPICVILWEWPTLMWWITYSYSKQPSCVSDSVMFLH